MHPKIKSIRTIFCVGFFLVCVFGFAQTKKILIYHETHGFRHSSIDAGIAMFESLGNQNGDWITDNSQNSNVFETSNLAQYDAVVFLNTSGSDETGSNGDLLSASEKAAFENFIASGKGFIGIHAATDTYRDKVWPFYNELVGAIIQISPNHTANNFTADLTVKAAHPITDFLGSIGSTWTKSEEYYYWELNGGQLSNDNIVLLEVESTGSNSYDAARPTTWYKESITYDDDNNPGTPDVTLNGIKSFYTSLGHNATDYSSNANFRNMLKNATLWAIGLTLNISEPHPDLDFKVLSNPVTDYLRLSFNTVQTEVSMNIYDVFGREINKWHVEPSSWTNHTFSIKYE